MPHGKQFDLGKWVRNSGFLDRDGAVGAARKELLELSGGRGSFPWIPRNYGLAKGKGPGQNGAK